MGGTLANKTSDATRQLIEEMALNYYQWSTREKKNVDDIHAVNAVTLLATYLEALTNKIDHLTSPRVVSVKHCEGCG